MPDWLLKLVPVALVILNALTAWAAWSLRQLAKTEVERIVAAAVQKLEAADSKICVTVDDHDERLIRLEEGIKSLPQQRDFKRLESTIGKLAEGQARTDALLEAVKDTNKATQTSVDRLYQYMLDNNK